MKLTKKHIVIISVVVVVLFGGLAAFWVWQAQGGRFFVTPDSSSNKKKENVPQYSKDKQQELTDSVNEKQGTGDYQGAIDLIEGQQNREDPALQVLLAGAYANAGELQKSLEIYKKLEGAGNLPDGEYANMAAVAERAKDYQLAIDMYKKAKEKAVSANQVGDDEAAYYDYKIAELEKKL